MQYHSETLLRFCWESYNELNLNLKHWQPVTAKMLAVDTSTKMDTAECCT